jgi:hypothetical protein
VGRAGAWEARDDDGALDGDLVDLRVPVVEVFQEQTVLQVAEQDSVAAPG